MVVKSAPTFFASIIPKTNSTKNIVSYNMINNSYHSPHIVHDSNRNNS